MAIGIGFSLFAHADRLSDSLVYGILVSSVFGCILFYFRNKTVKVLAGICLLFAHISLGYLLGKNAQLPKNESFYWNHYSFDSTEYITIELEESLRKKNTSWRATAKVIFLHQTNKTSFKVSGKVLVYWPVRRNPTIPTVEIGDQLLIPNRIMEMPGAAFPNDFDYKAVMRYRNVQHQIFLDSNSYKRSAIAKFSVLNFAKQSKAYLLNYISRLLPKDVIGLAESLSLGHKDHLDKKDAESFAKAGTMHVLAVSGLHVGMVYLILSFLFNLWNRGSKLKIYQSILIVLVLWSYAFVTGLGASVIRATLMFSIIELGRSIFKSKGSIYNSVFAAAFIQLLLFPLNLIEVGFQLSYLAVLGILFFYPKIFPLVNMPTYLLNKAWQLACVSLAATLGTLPVTLYFFHTFPVWFAFSNIILVPLGMIALILIIACLVLSFVPLVGSALIFCTTWVLRGLKMGVYFFAELPFAQLKNIYLSEIEVFLLLFFIPIAFLSTVNRNKRGMITISLFVFLFSAYWHWVEHGKKQQFMVIASELRNQLLISVVDGQNLTNISLPIPLSKSDSLFYYQKSFILSNSINKVSWTYVNPSDSIVYEHWSLTHSRKGYSILESNDIEPIIIHWTYAKSKVDKVGIHIIQKRFIKYSNLDVDFNILKNSFIIYK